MFPVRANLTTLRSMAVGDFHLASRRAQLPFLDLIGGTAFIWVPVAIYLWFTAGSAWAVGLLVWGMIVVGVIDNLLKPLTIGQGSGLPAVALFFGITGGLEIYGPLGLFAGPAVIAVFAALIRVYRRSYAARPPSSFV